MFQRSSPRCLELGVEMGGQILQLEFRRGDASATQLQSVVDEVLTELSSPDSEAARAARAAGLDVDDLAGTEVQVREGQQGVEPIATTIVVGIAVSIGSKVAESLWKDVLWPRIRRRLGWTAVKEQTSGSGGGASGGEESGGGES
jgi:hypothetical protein